MNSTTGALAAAALLSVAAPDASAAQSLELECQVRFVVDGVSSGRRQTGDWGVWKIEIDPGENWIYIKQARHFQIGGQTDLLQGTGREVVVTDDEILFCPALARPCGGQVSTADGWFKVSRARLDRRRSTFHITVEEREPSIHTVTTYSGPCAPPPEQQF